MIAYAAKDIERAIGLAPKDDYFIISNSSAFAESVKKQFPQNVILVESSTGELLGAADLIMQDKAIEFLAMHKGAGQDVPRLIVFKNDARIEAAAKELGWKLLNPPAALAEQIENKITQLAWLGDLAKYAPPHRVDIAKNIRWTGEQFVIQWAHGHTGDGTVLIRSEEELTALQHKFPERRCRITWYVNGPSFTVNAVVGPNGVFMGNINYQITGLAPFTANPFSTIGNDWKLARTLLSVEDKASIGQIVREVGTRMRQDSWHGLFGIDFMKDSATGRMFLIEINARQPASTTYESKLQAARRTQGIVGMTTFEAHIAALQNKPISELIEITDGAQIVQRITSSRESVSDEVIGSLELSGYGVLRYDNTDPNADLVRIQSEHGIMADHGVLNEVGEDIRDTLTQ